MSISRSGPEGPKQSAPDSHSSSRVNRYIKLDYQCFRCELSGYIILSTSCLNMFVNSEYAGSY